MDGPPTQGADGWFSLDAPQKPTRIASESDAQHQREKREDSRDSVSQDLFCGVGGGGHRAESEPLLRRERTLSFSRDGFGAGTQPGLPASQPPLPAVCSFDGGEAAQPVLSPQPCQPPPHMPPTQGSVSRVAELKHRPSMSPEPSWCTSGSQDAIAEVYPHPSDSRYAGCEATSQACVHLGDKVLYATDAAGKFERCAQKLAKEGRRGRKVPELQREPLELDKVTIKRKVRTGIAEEMEEGQPPRAQRRLEVKFEVANDLTKAARTQLAHAFRESVGPLRKNIRVDVEHVGGAAQVDPTDG